MRQHFLVAFSRVFGSIDAHNLNLWELMEAVQTANILTIRTCFAAETLCVSTVLDGQFLFVENHITIDICHGHFCRRNQVEVISCAVIHLAFLVGQLTCAVTRSSIYHRGGHYFGVTRLACFVKEEVNQRALQLCALTDINGETCTCNLHTEVKVDEVVLLCEFPVREHIRIGSSCFVNGGTTCLHHHIIFCRTTFGHFSIGQVGDGIELEFELFSSFCHLRFKRLCLLLNISHLLLCRFSLFLLAFLHQTTNALWERIHLCQKRIKFCLRILTAVVDFKHLLNSLSSTCKMLLFQTANHGFFVVQYLFNRKHNLFSNFSLCYSWQS